MDANRVINFVSIDIGKVANRVTSKLVACAPLAANSSPSLTDGAIFVVLVVPTCTVALVKTNARVFSVATI